MNKGWLIIIGAFAAGLYIPFEPFETELTTYEDCLLENLTPGLAEDAIALIHRTCDKKYRSEPDSSLPLLKADPPATWKDVTAREAFRHASPETRDMIRQFFFEWVILPMIPEDAIQEVRADFYAHTQSDVVNG